MPTTCSTTNDPCKCFFCRRDWDDAMHEFEELSSKIMRLESALRSSTSINVGLRHHFAEMYQVAGALGAPTRVLDNLSALACQQTAPFVTVLPIVDNEDDKVVAARHAAITDCIAAISLQADSKQVLAGTDYSVGAFLDWLVCNLRSWADKQHERAVISEATAVYKQLESGKPVNRGDPWTD